MGELESRFFEKKRQGKRGCLIKKDHSQSQTFLKILKRGIIKGNFVARGRPTKWNFRLDSIYNFIDK